MTRRVRFVIALLTASAVSLTAGCNDADVDVVINGTFVDDTCRHTFPWRPDIAGFTRFRDQSVMTFTGNRAIPLPENDVFTLVLRSTIDDDGESFVVSPGAEDQPAGSANATFLLRSSCHNSDTLLLDGTVTFSAIGRESGEMIEGTFSGDFVDGRNFERVLVRDVVGTFSFRYRTSEPFQPFPG